MIIFNVFQKVATAPWPATETVWLATSLSLATAELVAKTYGLPYVGWFEGEPPYEAFQGHAEYVYVRQTETVEAPPPPALDDAERSSRDVAAAAVEESIG